MKESITFKKVSHTDIIDLQKEWRQSLLRPQDGMWESFRDQGIQWGIVWKYSIVGYACLNEENVLIQFYVDGKNRSKTQVIFEKFILDFNITSGIAGTNNPIFHAAASHLSKNKKLHTYLFDHTEQRIDNHKDGILKACQQHDIQSAVNFYHYCIQADKEWLHSYLGNLISRGQIFLFSNEDEMIGACEVRTSITSPNYADIGMLVSPEHRRQGYGTFLLNSAKKIAEQWDKKPICSCEAENIGSMKSILNAGFESKFQLYFYSF